MLRLNLVLIAILSLLTPSLGNADDYVLSGEGKKCPFDDARLFKFEDTTLEACREHCELVPACKQFTFGEYKGVPMCMGCGQTNLHEHAGFNTYELQGRQEETKGMVNLKCPYHHPRLFRKENVNTLKACEHQCLDDHTCSHYSYGMYKSKLICIGCDAQEKNGEPVLQHHTGFTTYESRPASEFETCTASGWGDPHIITFDGLTYDAHVPGEVILMKNASSTTEIQGRLEKVKEGKMPAVITGLAIRGNDPSLPVIQISMAEDPAAVGTVPDKRGNGPCPAELFVNGKLVDIAGQNDDPAVSTPSDSSSIYDIDTGSDGVSVVLRKSTFYVEMPELSVDLTVYRSKMYKSGKCLFSIDVHLLNCKPDLPIVGMLGSPNDKKGDDWMKRDGSVLPLPGGPNGKKKMYFKPAFDYVKENWLISEEDESLFEYEAGTSFSDFASGGAQAEYDPAIEDLVDGPNDPELDLLCQGDIGCLIDGKTLGVEDAEDYVENPASTRDLTEEEEEASSQTESKVISGSKGDPHFKTWKQERFEYHGQCDMVLTKDVGFADGLGFEVQIRTKLIRFWSYIKNAAIRIGDDILEVQGSLQEDPERNYWINLEYQGDLKTLGGFPVEVRCPASYRCKYEIDLSSKYPGQKIVIGFFKEFVSVDFPNSKEEAFGNSSGMLGDFHTGKTLARDGVTELHDFYEFGSEWQVLPFEHMLFHDVEEPQFPKRCLIPEDPRGNRRRRLDEKSVSEADAEKACASIADPMDRKDCIYDILATQDVEMVGAY